MSFLKITGVRVLAARVQKMRVQFCGSEFVSSGADCASCVSLHDDSYVCSCVTLPSAQA